MQLAAKDLVHPMNSDHILGKTSLQNKPMDHRHAKNIQVCRGRVLNCSLLLSRNHFQIVRLGNTVWENRWSLLSYPSCKMRLFGIFSNIVVVD